MPVQLVSRPASLPRRTESSPIIEPVRESDRESDLPAHWPAGGVIGGGASELLPTNSFRRSGKIWSMNTPKAEHFGTPI